jgi:hypothetical protein
MFEYLKALAARIRRQGFEGLPPPALDDPDAGVREPRGGGPGGRSTAAALAEPGEPLTVHARGSMIGPTTTRRSSAT